MKKTDFWFVIVAYHPDRRILHNLLLALGDYPVVVIDNGGLDKHTIPSHVHVFTQKENTGYSAGANIGIAYALKHNALWVTVLNQDVLAPKSSFDRLTDILSETHPGIAGPFGGNLDPHRWTSIYPSSTTSYISGSCISIHSNVVAKIGLFYEPYFLYYEDVDLCMRAVAKGFAVTKLIVPGLSHEDSVTLGRGSCAHQYYLARNHLLFVKRQSPYRIKLRELIRLPKTAYEHMIGKHYGAVKGLVDFMRGKFGRWEEQT